MKNMQRQPNKQQGFTLIELMLAIAVIAAIAVMGLAAYQQKVLNTKIDKAALQMQTWLQAGMVYYNKNQVWPTQATQLYNQPNGDNYIPVLNNGKPAPNPWSDGNDPAGIYSIPTTQTANAFTFKVETTIPADQFPNGEADKVAEMIAARLPNAKVLPNTSTVQAEVNVPGSSSNTGDVIIKRVMRIVSDGQVPEPICGNGWSPEIKVGVASFQSSDQKNPSTIKQLVTNVPDREHPTPCTGTDFPEHLCYHPTLVVYGHAAPGTGELIAVTSCVRNNASQLTQTNNHYRF